MQYNDFVNRLNQQAIDAFEEISAEFNFDFGDEFEVAICKLLRKILPTKYGICRGFVVSRIGEIAGDDIIIYNKESFPRLRGKDEDNFALKEQVPIESVYAYIEAKHKLTDKTLRTAISQIEKVKKLVSNRAKTPVDRYHKDIVSSFPGKDSGSFNVYPDFGNPIFTMIWSNKSEANNGSKGFDKACNMISDIITELDLDKNSLAPDLIIAGDASYTIPAKVGNDTEKRVIMSFRPAPFLLPEKDVEYVTVDSKELNFGLAMIHLIWAIDWIQLGRINYQGIVLDTLVQTFNNILKSDT